MQACLLVGPTTVEGGGGGGNRNLLVGPSAWWPHSRCHSIHRRSVVASAAINGGEPNHYAVLGVSTDASSADIKKAYRLLALKYHPDVSKDSRADEVFKNIRLAYDVLSSETKRNQYDRALKSEEDNWDYNPEFEDGVRIYRWADMRRRMQCERYWEKYSARDGNSSFYYESDEVSEEEEIPDEERGSFVEVLKSAFLSPFLMQTIGTRLSLTFSSLMALLDRKLDSGYKVGYMIAWMLGGRSGILLSLCLSFASWVCGKTSSSVVALVVVAMWIGSNLARYAPIPQGQKKNKKMPVCIFSLSSLHLSPPRNPSPLVSTHRRLFQMKESMTKLDNCTESTTAPAPWVRKGRRICKAGSSELKIGSASFKIMKTFQAT